MLRKYIEISTKSSYTNPTLVKYSIGLLYTAMPKTDVSKKDKKHRTHNENRLHAHQEVHIHIGDKKKAKRRRRKARAGHGSAVVSTMHSHVATAQPSYPVYINRPQFFDPTTQADRERNQPMANAPAFGTHVPAQGNGFNPTTPPTPAERPPLTEREMHPPMVDTYSGPAEKIAATPHRPFAYQNDDSWRSPSFFSSVNPMHHSSLGEFRDENTASLRAKQQEEEEAEREREWENREKQREIDRKVAAFDDIQVKSAQRKTDKALTRQATKLRKENEAAAQIAAQAEKRANTNALSAATKATKKAAAAAEVAKKAANEEGQAKKWGRVQTDMGSFFKR
jgi:hypothetical protein